MEAVISRRHFPSSFVFVGLLYFMCGCSIDEPDVRSLKTDASSESAAIIIDLVTWNQPRIVQSFGSEITLRVLQLGVTQQQSYNPLPVSQGVAELKISITNHLKEPVSISLVASAETSVGIVDEVSDGHLFDLKAAETRRTEFLVLVDRMSGPDSQGELNYVFAKQLTIRAFRVDNSCG